MDKNINKESWINVLMATLLGIFLIYVYRSLSSLVYAFQVFPFLVLYINEDWKKTTLSLVITFVAGIFLVDYISLAFMALYVTLITFYAGNAIKNRIKLSEIILNSAFISLALTLIAFGVSYYITRINPFEEVGKILSQSIDEMINTMKNGIDFTKADIEVFERVFREAANKAVTIIPAIIFVGRYLMVAVNILIGLSILNKTRDDINYATKLNGYMPGNNLKMATLFTLAIALVMYLINYEYLNLFISNMAMAIGFFYFLDGFFVADFMYEKQGRKIARILIPIVLILIFQGYLVYVFIGLLDVIFNFRRRILTNGAKKDQ